MTTQTIDGPALLSSMRESDNNVRALWSNDSDGRVSVKWPMCSASLITTMTGTIKSMNDAWASVLKKKVPEKKSEPDSTSMSSPSKSAKISSREAQRLLLLNAKKKMLLNAKKSEEQSMKDSDDADEKNNPASSSDSDSDGDDTLSDEVTNAEQAELDAIRRKYEKLIRDEDDEDEIEHYRRTMRKKLKSKRDEQLEERRVIKADRKAARDEDSNDDDDVDESKFDMNTKEGRRAFYRAKAKSMVAGGAHDADRDDSEEEAELADLEAREAAEGAAMYDDSLTGSELHKADEATKQAELKRRREEERDMRKRAKAVELAMQSKLEGYERETDDEDGDGDAVMSETNAKVDSTAAKSMFSTSGANSKSSVKNALLFAAMMKNKKALSAAAVKKTKPVKKEEEASEEEDKREEALSKMRPRMLHRCVLPEKLLNEAEEQKNATREIIFNTPGFLEGDVSKVAQSEDYQRRADELYEAMLSQAMLYMMSVTDPKKYATLLSTAIPACAKFEGDYSDDLLWTQRNKRMLFDGDDARPIDVAYTLDKLDQMSKTLPDAYNDEVAGSLILSFFQHEAFKTRVTKMTATANDVRTVNAKLRAEKKKPAVTVDDGESEEDEAPVWKCAVTGIAIEEGMPIMCITSAPCPIADLARRDAWLRKCIVAGAMPGVKSMQEFKKSEYAKEEMLSAPLCAFIIDREALEKMSIEEEEEEEKQLEVNEEEKAEEEEKQSEEEEEEKAEEEEKQSEEEEEEKAEEDEKQSEEDEKQSEEEEKKSEVKEEEDEKMSELNQNGKRKRDNEEDTEKSEGGKKRKRPCFDVMPFPYPPAPTYDMTRAAMEDNFITYRIEPVVKDRRFVASSHANAERIGPNFQYFFTDNAVKQAEEAKRYLYESQQFGVQPLQWCVQLDTALKTLFADWPYDDEMLNTASCLATKMRTLSESVRNPDGTKIVFNYDKFGELLLFVLCTLVHPCEKTLLKPKDITGRDRVSLKPDCATSMQIGEIPFGRQFTTNEFVSQFARLVVDALHWQVVMPLAFGDKEMVDFSGEALFKALEKQCEMEAKETPEETKKRLEEAGKEWSGRMSKQKSILRDEIAKAWKTVRQALRNHDMAENVSKTAQCQMFINRLFPIHY